MVLLTTTLIVVVIIVVLLVLVVLLILVILLVLLAFLLLALRFGQHPRVVFSMLLKVLGSDAVVRKLGIARQLIVFFDNLLRRSAHFAFGA